MPDTSASKISPLRERRLALELAQQYVAAKSGVARSTIVAIEIYGHRPRRSTYEKLAAVLRTTPEALGATPLVDPDAPWPPEESNGHTD